MSGKPAPVLAGCMAAGILCGSFVSGPPTRLSFLAVGQGDCAVFQHAGATVLIDAGPRANGIDAGERIVVPRLSSLGARRVDLVLLSHPDEDHIGGVGAILKAHPRARIAMSAAFRDHEAVKERMREWKLRPEQILWLPRRARLAIDGYTLDIANPAAINPGEDNEGSMFVRISNGKSYAVFSGDAGEQTESLMAGSGDWSAQVMHAGHHGSKTSTAQAWIDEVRPALAVVSCGRDNQYGHPYRGVLDRLQSSGVRVLRTDLHGDILLRPTERGWQLERIGR